MKDTIAKQIIFSLVLLILLSLLFTGGTLVYLSFHTQKQQLNILLKEHSQIAALKINSYLEDLQNKRIYLARVRGLTNFQPTKQRVLLTGLVRHNSAYESIMILDNTGQIRTAVSPFTQITLENLRTSPLFLRPFKQKENFISPVEIDPNHLIPILSMAVPIRNDQDQVDGVLLACINLKFLGYIVSEIKVGRTGYVYVADNRNVLIAKKDYLGDTFQLMDISDEPSIQKLRSDVWESVATYQGLNKKKVLGISTSVRCARWDVIVELPMAEAYAPIKNMFFVMIFALGVATLFTIGVSFIIIRQIIRPISILTKTMTHVAQNQDLSHYVVLKSSNEIGQLAASFNQMDVG